jgi:hypothetical protein
MLILQAAAPPSTLVSSDSSSEVSSPDTSGCLAACDETMSATITVVGDSVLEQKKAVGMGMVVGKMIQKSQVVEICVSFQAGMWSLVLFSVGFKL